MLPILATGRNTPLQSHDIEANGKNNAPSDSLTFLTGLQNAVSTAVCSDYTTDVQMAPISLIQFLIFLQLNITADVPD